MNSFLDYLGAEHRSCDDLFASTEAAVAQKDWDRARSLFARFRAAMLRHLLMEEEVLFLAFETHTANRMGPTRVMRMEHEQMRRMMQDMARTLADADHPRYLGLSETLNSLMQKHNLKEENLLFPMFDQILGNERDDLIRSMEAIAG